MGEAKRRKILDPNFGLTQEIEINEKLFKLKEYYGYLEVKDGYFRIAFTDDTTNDECDVINDFFDHIIVYFLQKYPNQNFFRIKVDFRKFKTANKAIFRMYPAFWDITPRREYREERVIELSTSELKKLEETITEKNRKSPIEHIRKAHKRRVRYGKGRQFTKWVDIQETCVNASD